MCRFVFVLLGLIAISAVEAKRKSLVLVDDAGRQSTHSKFIRSLKDRGNDVTVMLATSSDIEIKKYGEFLFDSIVLLCPETKEFGGDLDEKSLLEFVDAGKALVVIGSQTVGAAVREVASECGVEFNPKKTSVLDHFNFDAADNGAHTLIAADKFSSSSILNNFDRSAILYQGIGLSIDNENPLVTKLAFGSATTYSANSAETIEKKPLSAGKDTVLVAAVQTRGTGRILVSGSIDLFSDRLLDSRINGSPSGNAKFVDSALGWTLQERGILRSRDLTHHLRPTGEHNPRMYRVKDEITFSIVIEEFDGKTDSWKPFVADDVQLEFRMLDPYVRTFLTPTGDGTFTVDFKIPDVYGVFKFQIDYRRDGYSHVIVEQEAGVRPFRHNEFERFIVSANPYYLSAGLMMGGFVLFSFVFLFTKEKEKTA